MRLLIDAGADVSVIDNAVAHGANATVFPLLRLLGVNLKAVDDRGNTPFHSARDIAAMVALFAHGAATVAMNNAYLTPFDMFLLRFEPDPWSESEDAMLVFMAGGLVFDLEFDPAQLQTLNDDLAWWLDEVLRFGRGWNSSETDEEGIWLEGVFEQQHDLFRARAFQVCVGLQSLRMSALEMCEVLAYMFAPMESIVPFSFAWRVVVTVKHFKQRQ
jgi:hypothetical protein